MKTRLTSRARRMKNQLRHLVCERLERRYAMHAMPWGSHWNDDDRSFLSQDDALDTIVASKDCSTAGLRGEGEADSFTGNMIPNGSSFRSGGMHALGGPSQRMGEFFNRSQFSSPGEGLNTNVRQEVVSNKPNSPIKSGAAIEVVELESALPTTSAIVSATTSKPIIELARQLSDGSSLVAHTELAAVTHTPVTNSGNVASSNSSIQAKTSIDVGIGLTLGSNNGPAVRSSTGNGTSNFSLRNDPVGLGNASPNVSSSHVSTSGETRAAAANSSASLVSQATTSYQATRSLNLNSSAAVQRRLEAADVESETSWRSTIQSTDDEGPSSALRAVIDNLAQQRSAQRTAAARKSSDSGMESDLALDAIERAQRDRIHDDGLLELATLPERLANDSSLEPYDAIENVASQRRSFNLAQLETIREFELAGENLAHLDLLAEPEKMLVETPRHAIAAIDAWHAESQSADELASQAIDSSNSVLNRSFLPLSFLAVSGLLIASRKKYRQLKKQRSV